jgi:hypothetical protein
MLELQPYRGKFTQAIQSSAAEQVPGLRYAAVFANLMNLRRSGLKGRLILGATIAWVILGFLALALGWTFVDVEGVPLLKTLTCAGPCAILLVLAVGALFILIGGSMLWDAVVARRVAKPTMWASADRLRCGDELDLTFRQDINSAVDVQNVIMKLILRETATYTSGTDTTTVTHDNLVQQVERPGRHMQKGYLLEERVVLDIPPDAMHTFSAHKNSLQWFVTVQVSLAGWPDFHEIYEVTVLPETA